MDYKFDEVLFNKVLILALEKMNVGILLAGIGGEVLWINDEGLKIMELNKEEIIGKRPRDINRINHRDSMPHWQDVLEEYDQNPSKFEMTIPVTKKNGNEMWVQVINMPFKSESENRKYQFEIIKDVTQEEEKKHSNQRMSFILKSINNAILTLNLKGEITFSNSAVLPFTALSDGDFEGKILEDVIDFDVSTPTEDIISVYLKKPTFLSIEHLIHTPNGPKWVRMERTPIFSNRGRLVETICLLIDVTEAHDSLNEIKRLHELAKSRLGEVLFLNTVLKESTRFKGSVSEYIDYVKSTVNVRLSKEIGLNVSLQIKPSIPSIRITQIQKNSNQSHLREFISALELIFRAILNHLVEEQKFVNGLVEIEQKERERISLELHNGLTQQLATISMKLKKAVHTVEEVEEKKSDTNTIISDLDKAIDDVRRISHNLMPSSFNYGGIIEALTILTSTISNSSNVKVEFYHSYDGSLSEKIELILYRCAQECLNNSIKYSNATKIKLSLEKEETQLVLSVDDNGKGITKEEIQSGFGIKQMNRLINNLNGEFFVGTKEEGGSEIIVKL